MHARDALDFALLLGGIVVAAAVVAACLAWFSGLLDAPAGFDDVDEG